MKPFFSQAAKISESEGGRKRGKESTDVRVDKTRVLSDQPDSDSFLLVGHGLSTLLPDELDTGNRNLTRHCLCTALAFRKT